MGRGHKFGVGHGGILLFYIKVVLLDFYGERHPAFCLCRIMVLSFSVVDGLDFQFVAVTLELLILFGGAFHRQEAVYHREKGDWVVVELFIIGHLFIGQTDKAVITIPTNNERPGNAAIIPIKTVWRQIKVLRGVIADNASVIPPRVANG